jgi:multiple sugar transport system ATP-binding protein
MRAELKTILAKSQASTIYVTHDQVEAMSLADRIAIMDQGVIVQCDTPIEIYRNPATTFVAGFIGNPPMNFLPAKAVQDGVYEVAGMRLAGPAGYSELTLGVRPEDLHVAGDGLALQADVIEPLGAHTLVTALQAQGVFRAALPSDLALSPKQMLHLQPDLSRIRWYDGAGKMVPVA